VKEEYRMRVFLAALLFASSISFAADETVTVEGPRLPPSDPGPSAGGPVGGGSDGGIGKPMPCAEPTCGGLIDPKEPGSGSGDAVTTDEKNSKNKSTTEKVKKYGQSALEALKNTANVMMTIRKILGLEYNDVDASSTETLAPDGTKTTKTECKGRIVKLGGDGKNPCVEIMTNKQLVELKNGDLQDQVSVTYTILDECYYTRQCGIKAFTFIAGSETELKRLVNTALGENYL
jgi:hypothetical protein